MPIAPYMTYYIEGLLRQSNAQFARDYLGIRDGVYIKDSANLDNGLVIQSGYVASTAATKDSISLEASTRRPITLDRAGAVRDLGTLTLLVTGIGGNTVTRASFDFDEIR